MRAQALRVDVNLNVANNIVVARHDIVCSGELSLSLFKASPKDEANWQHLQIDDVNFLFLFATLSSWDLITVGSFKYQSDRREVIIVKQDFSFIFLFKWLIKRSSCDNTPRAYPVAR